MSKRTRGFISAIEIDEKLIKKICLLWVTDCYNGYNGELTGLAKYHWSSK